MPKGPRGEKRLADANRQFAAVPLEAFSCLGEEPLPQGPIPRNCVRSDNSRDRDIRHRANRQCGTGMTVASFARYGI